MSGTSERLAGNVVTVIGMVIWATNFPVAAEILKTWQPLVLTPIRFAIAGLVVAVAAAAMGQGIVMLRLVADRRVLMASVAYSFSAMTFVWGQKLTDPVTAAVIVSSMPLISAVMGWRNGRESFTPLLVMALVLAIAGGILTSTADVPAGSVESSLAGAAAVLVGTILYVWYTRILVEDLPLVPAAAKAAATTWLATLLTAIIAASATATGVVPLEYDLAGRTLALIGWLGAVAIGLTAVLWLWSSRVIGVTVACVHNNLVPFYVIVLAAMSGSVITAQHLWGALLVLAGAVLAQLPPSVLGPRPEGA